MWKTGDSGFISRRGRALRDPPWAVINGSVVMFVLNAIAGFQRVAQVPLSLSKGARPLRDLNQDK